MLKYSVGLRQTAALATPFSWQLSAGSSWENRLLTGKLLGWITGYLGKCRLGNWMENTHHLPSRCPVTSPQPLSDWQQETVTVTLPCCCCCWQLPVMCSTVCVRQDTAKRNVCLVDPDGKDFNNPPKVAVMRFGPSAAGYQLQRNRQLTISTNTKIKLTLKNNCHDIFRVLLKYSRHISQLSWRLNVQLKFFFKSVRNPPAHIPIKCDGKCKSRGLYRNFKAKQRLVNSGYSFLKTCCWLREIEAYIWNITFQHSHCFLNEAGDRNRKLLWN